MIRIIGNGGHARVLLALIQACGVETYTGNLIGVGDNLARKKESERYDNYISLVHPTAVVDRSVEIGEGTVVLENAVIQTGCKIGKHVIINAGAIVCHDCIIGDYAHIAPGAVLCGSVVVGEGALVGACAVPGAVIKPWSLVKAGTVCK